MISAKEFYCDKKWKYLDKINWICLYDVRVNLNVFECIKKAHKILLLADSAGF